MAGPIRNLISMMRENRQQRLEEGTALLPGLRRRGERGDQQEDRPGVRSLFRSLGVGSARNDHMMDRRAIVKPADRAIQEDATDPDTTYSRPYSGDGPDNPAGVRATTVSSKRQSSSELLPTPVPEPVKGDQNSLPDVPAMDSAGVKKKIMEVSQKIERAKTPSEVNALKAQLASLRSLAEMDYIDRGLEDKRRQSSFSYNMGQVGDAAKQAAATGDFASLEAMVNSSNAMAPKDSAGNFIAGARPNVREIVRPAVRDHVAGVLNGRDYSTLDQREKSVLHSGIQYAYPVQLVDDKNVVLPADKIVSEANKLYARLSADFPVSNKETRQFLRHLANVTVKQQAAILGVTGLQLPQNP